MAGFYSEYYDGTNYVPCVFKKFNGTTDDQVYQVKYYNGSSDITIGTLPVVNYMSDGYWDWEVADNTPISNYSWTGATNYTITGGKLKCATGKGTYGVSCGYTPAITYTRLEFELQSGWTGSHVLAGWGGNAYIDISPTSVQLRIGGVWQTQISGTYNNATNVIGINTTGSVVGIVVNGIIMATSSGTIGNNGPIEIILVPGANVTTTGINFVRYY